MLCGLIGGGIMFLLGVPDGIVVLIVAIPLFVSIAWYAFSHLDLNCPRCGNNVFFDVGSPAKTFFWFMFYVDPVICSNCRLNLSKPYSTDQL